MNWAGAPISGMSGSTVAAASLPDAAYSAELPADIRNGSTGVPVIDAAVATLYASGTLHNHARMWLASYVVHVRKLHWRAGADWLYGHLLDGDLASNHLSWQWVAGTGSHKPYLFNADNVARYAPADWHSPGSVIDTSYETLDRLARQGSKHAAPQASRHTERKPSHADATREPACSGQPPAWLSMKAPDAAAVSGRDVWLLHPWNLGQPPPDLATDTVLLAVCVEDFHQAWPWNDQRWRFVGSRMAELTPQRWYGSSQQIGTALAQARSVRSVAEPHLAPWLQQWATCESPPALFAEVSRRCDSFSQWWAKVSRGLGPATDLLQADAKRQWALPLQTSLDLQAGRAA
jgi:deoxyribodipyrimidine photo-lyase